MKKTIIIFWIVFSFLKQGFTNQSVTNPDSLNNAINKARTELQESKSIINAVIKGDYELVKGLTEKGNDPNWIDEKGYTALDYAKKRNRQNIESYLNSIGAKTYPKTLSCIIDGPFISISDSSTVTILYLKHDSIKNLSSINSKNYNFKDFPRKVDGIPIDSKDIDITRKKTYPRSIFNDIEKIFIVGDVHGEYDRVLNLLKANKIVSEKGDWIWEKGHLVFMGDIFDRGPKVTEMLWFIFSLEKQAEKSGGKVHLLLGNHEPMIFKKDYRYVADKYYALCENLGLSYSSLFNEKTVLGNWIRQKPAILKINDFVFLHAGIPPKLLDMKLEVDTINKIVWDYFNNNEAQKNSESRAFILSSKGILWYRGFVDDDSRREVIDEKILANELIFYKAKAFVIGHTEVDSISTFFNGKVIDVNIPKAHHRIPEQGLLIEKNRAYIVFDTTKQIEILNTK